MIEDSELLRLFAEEKSQEAFAEVVRRRLDLVYSVALRQVGGDAHLAQDVTQKVFVDLARKAPLLAGRAVLSGWLYRSAHYAASDLVRAERRRRVREEESQALHAAATSPVSQDDWEKLRSLLDDAMSELNDGDRDAVALRFFEGRPFAEIGRRLQLSEDGARKRVERALDKLGATLSRRGINSTSAALGLAMMNHTLVAAPAGLAASVTGQAMAGAVAAASGAGGTAAFLGFIGSSKVALGAVAVAAAVGAGVAVRQSRIAAERTAELAAARGAHAAAEETVADLRQRLRWSEQQAQGAEHDVNQLLTAMEQVRPGRGAAGASDAPAAAEAGDGPITHDLVQARFRRGQELARTGRVDAALAEFVWCLDRGMPAIPSFTGVRRSYLLSDLARLGEKGRAVLLARRDAAEKALRASSSFDAAADFAAMNRTLGENERTLTVYDGLAAQDAVRRPMDIVVCDLLIERRRYAEAARIRSYASMLQQLEVTTKERPAPANMPRPAAFQDSLLRYAVQTAAKNVEVLAGAGRSGDARALAEKVLAYDASVDTRTILQAHVLRAGAPDLLADLLGR